MKRRIKFNKMLISIALFVFLFYNEASIGINFSMLSICLWTLSLEKRPVTRRSREFWLLSAALFLSVCSYAWYGDAMSFLSLFTAVMAFCIYTQYRRLNIVLYPLLAFYSFSTFIIRIFLINKWIPRRKLNNQFARKLVSFFIIPALFTLIFIAVYSSGSAMFASFFSNIHFNFDPGTLLFLLIAGLYFMFNYWYIMIPKIFVRVNQHIDYKLVPSAGYKDGDQFLNKHFELKSGEISLVLLNVLLLFFIITYNYEQFTQVAVMGNLSDEIHQRIVSIIISIIMAIGIIMFYFKSASNFNPDAALLKKLAIVWIFENLLLIVSAFIKNAEYIHYMGLTIKRIGVVIFLLLCTAGLVLTFFKIKYKRSNYYLAGNMLIIFFAIMIINSAINWSWILTSYNLSYQKTPDTRYLQTLEFNKQILYHHYKNNPAWQDYFKQEKATIQNKKQQSFLSKVLYYESIHLN